MVKEGAGGWGTLSRRPVPGPGGLAWLTLQGALPGTRPPRGESWRSQKEKVPWSWALSGSVLRRDDARGLLTFLGQHSCGGCYVAP